MGGQVTFFLNSASNLSSNGWKLPAEGVNESCMSKHREGGGGSWQAGRSWRWEGQRGALSPRGCEPRVWGRPPEHPALGREALGGRLTQHLSLSTLGFQDKGRGVSARLLAYRRGRSVARTAGLLGRSGAGAGPRHPSLMAA